MKKIDYLQWMRDSAQGEEMGNKYNASIKLKLGFAAFHTSAAAPTQLLFDMYILPEYIVPPRQEVEEVIAEQEALMRQALLKFVRIDSFMKENQRFNRLLLSRFKPIPPHMFNIGGGLK